MRGGPTGALLRDETAAIELAGLAHSDQGFEHFLHATTRGLVEAAGEVGRGSRPGGERRAEGNELVGRAAGPGADFRGGCLLHGQLALYGATSEQGRLIVGTKPADETGVFLGATLGVERDDTGADGSVGKIGGPAIGGSNGLVEAVVESTQDGDLPGNRNDNQRKLRPLSHHIMSRLRDTVPCCALDPE